MEKIVTCCQLPIEQQSAHTMGKAVFSVGELDLNKQIAMTTTRLGIEDAGKKSWKEEFFIFSLLWIFRANTINILGFAKTN